MKQFLLPTAAVLALASAQADAGTLIGSFFPVIASTENAAPAGTQGAFGGPLGPGGAVGGIGGPIDFTAPFAGTLTMTITDCCVVGDVYQAFVNGVSLGDTLPEPLNGPTASTGTFTASIAAGTNDYDVADILLQYLGHVDPYGFVGSSSTVAGDLNPAAFTVTLSETPTATAVPEPASLALLGSGLIGLGLVRRRRKAAK